MITDTGERREMFGLQARRVKVVTTREPSAAACDKSQTRSETDGWYADLPVSMQCPGAEKASSATDKPECADTVTVESSGPPAALGYPLSYTTTTTDGGKVLSSVTMEATALTTQPVDTASTRCRPVTRECRMRESSRAPSWPRKVRGQRRPGSSASASCCRRTAVAQLWSPWRSATNCSTRWR